MQALAENIANVASSYYGTNVFNDAEESDIIEDDEHAMGIHDRYDKMRKGMTWINEMRAKEAAIKSRPGPWGFKITKAVNPFASSDDDLISTIASDAHIIGTASNFAAPMKGKMVTMKSDDESDYSNKDNNLDGGVPVIIAPMEGKKVTIESDDESDYNNKENNMDGGVSVTIAIDEDAKVIKSPGPSRYQLGENLNNFTSSDEKFMGTLDSDVATSDSWGLDIGAMDLNEDSPRYRSALSFKNMAKVPIDSNDNRMYFDDALSAGSWASPWNRMGKGRKVGEGMDFKGLDLNVALSAGSWASSKGEVVAESMDFNDALSAGTWGPLWSTPKGNLVANEYDDEAMNFNDGLSAGSLASRKGKVFAIESDDEAMDVDTGLTSLSLTSSPMKRSLDSSFPSAIPTKRAKRSPLPGVGVPLSERPRDRKKLIKLLTVPRNKGFLDAFEKRHLEPFLKKPVAERIPDELKLQVFADAAEQWFDEGKCFHVIANTNGFELSLWQGCRHRGCILPVGLQVNKLSRDITLRVMFIRALKSDGLSHYVPSVAPFMYQGLVILDLDRKEMVRLESERELSEEYRKYVAVQRLKALHLLADRNLNDTGY